jgi:cytochrome c oxidase subunit 4
MRESHVFVLTWLGLLALLAIQVLAATLLSGPLGHGVVALAALCMVVLIWTLFMDLRNSRGLIRVYAVGGVLWLAFLITLTLADYLTREEPVMSTQVTTQETDTVAPRTGTNP